MFINCSCGSVIKEKSYKAHIKTKKHKNYLKPKAQPKAKRRPKNDRPAPVRPYVPQESTPMKPITLNEGFIKTPIPARHQNKSFFNYLFRLNYNEQEQEI